MVKRSERENGQEAGFHSCPKCNLIKSQKAEKGMQGLKARVTVKVANRAVPVSADDSLRCSQRAAVFTAWLYTGSSQCESKELTIVHFHVLGSFGVSSSTLQSCCTDCSSNHRRKGWCVAVGSISNLSI